MKRTDFLKTLTATMAAAIVAPAAARTTTLGRPQMEGTPADERFWELLRDQFPLTRDRIYLNTGGLGASP